MRSSGRSGTSWADMCRMLGIVSRKPAPVDTLLAFRQLADTGRNFRDFGCPQPNPKAGHPDGWGIACIGAEGEFYVRGPGKATADPRYEEFVRRLARICSPPLLLVAHLRYASKKDTIQEQYSHPFRREVDGRVTFFAHNGEIEGFGLREGKGGDRHGVPAEGRIVHVPHARREPPDRPSGRPDVRPVLHAPRDRDRRHAARLLGSPPDAPGAMAHAPERGVFRGPLVRAAAGRHGEMDVPNSVPAPGKSLGGMNREKRVWPRGRVNIIPVSYA